MTWLSTVGVRGQDFRVTRGDEGESGGETRPPGASPRLVVACLRGECRGTRRTRGTRGTLQTRDGTQRPTSVHRCIAIHTARHGARYTQYAYRDAMRCDT